jgi:hypothetical protein
MPLTVVRQQNQPLYRTIILHIFQPQQLCKHTLRNLPKRLLGPLLLHLRRTSVGRLRTPQTLLGKWILPLLPRITEVLLSNISGCTYYSSDMKRLVVEPQLSPNAQESMKTMPVRLRAAYVQFFTQQVSRQAPTASFMASLESDLPSSSTSGPSLGTEEKSPTLSRTPGANSDGDSSTNVDQPGSAHPVLSVHTTHSAYLPTICMPETFRTPSSNATEFLATTPASRDIAGMSS